MAAAAVTAAVLLPGSAVANPDKPMKVRTTLEVVAEGLDTPRGLTYDRQNGRILVAEAGEAAGNLGQCGAGNGGAVYCYGTTGAVFQYSTTTGAQQRVATGLPSLRTEDFSAVLGLHDLAVDSGTITGVFGLSGSKNSGPFPFRDNLCGGDAADNLCAKLATASRIAPGDGNVSLLGDLAAWEDANNPDGKRIDSDPFGVYTTNDGTVVVADAGGNGILLVNPSTHQVQQGVFLPPRDFGGDPDYESVPTSVIKGPDGAFYISELTGFPYHVGSARILRWVPGQTSATVYATGFTNIIDFTFDNKDRLVVLEIAKFGLASETDSVTGRLVRVERNGQHTELASSGLENPGGVAVAGNNTFYVTNRTTGNGNTGQLLRLTVSG